MRFRIDLVTLMPIWLLFKTKFGSYQVLRLTSLPHLLLTYSAPGSIAYSHKATEYCYRLALLAERGERHVNAVNRLTLATHCLVGISSLVGLLFTCKTTRVILTSTTDDISATRYNIYWASLKYFVCFNLTKKSIDLSIYKNRSKHAQSVESSTHGYNRHIDVS